eukprot:132490-Chlamydomonas_euryale.AAC.1
MCPSPACQTGTGAPSGPRCQRCAWRTGRSPAPSRRTQPQTAPAAAPARASRPARGVHMRAQSGGGGGGGGGDV